MHRIAWYARDGYVDFFPALARELRHLGVAASAGFICNHSAEADRLKRTHGIDDARVVAKSLRPEDPLSLEERIRELEGRYPGRSLVECVWPDRFEKDVGDDACRRNLVAHFAFWEEFLDPQRIDLLVSEQPSILSGCVAWLVCRARGIEFLGFSEIAPLGNRVAFTSSWEGHFDGLYDEEMDEVERQPRVAADAYLEMVAEQGVQKARRAVLDLIESRRRRLWRGFGEPRYGIANPLRRIRKENEYYVSRTLRQRFAGRWRRTVNPWLWRCLGQFSTASELEGKRFFFFPLHMPGEWSNYPSLGLRSGDQLSTVRELAHCQPLGTVLCVKEHTAEFGARPTSFYRALRRLPRVVVLGPNEDTARLVRQSQAVITLGSTVGFEAFLLKKPVLLLGRPWYWKLPGMFTADRPEELASLMQDASRLPSATACEIRTAVRRLFAISFEGVMYPLEQLLSKDNLKRFAEAIGRRLKERRSSQESDQTLAGEHAAGY